jgi:Mce-associated membrane protein
VEGQQPDSGDLNDSESEVSQPEVPESEVPESAESESAESESEESEDPAPEPVKEPSAARKWLTRNKKRLALVSSAGLFVGAGAFAGAAVEPYLMERATVATKEQIARTAADAIATLWSYTPDDMDKLSERSARYLGGDFGVQYRRYVDAIAPTNKQAQVSSSTAVVAAAVESLRGSEATALVYTNTTSTSPNSNNIPSLKYLSYRLELQREGRDWRVTKMTTVTSLDLTPKL